MIVGRWNFHFHQKLEIKINMVMFFIVEFFFREREKKNQWD